MIMIDNCIDINSVETCMNQIGIHIPNAMTTTKMNLRKGRKRKRDVCDEGLLTKSWLLNIQDIESFLAKSRQHEQEASNLFLGMIVLAFMLVFSLWYSLSYPDVLIYVDMSA